MIKYILVMIICSGIPGNKCKPIPTPIYEFEKYHECIIYGYDYSSQLLKTFDTKSIDEFEMFTAFDCKENTTI
jgi:hypothetical protein|tara:strand:+ start:273 stop:491 length:219 start_codon:yes stop_codon:yes gene_type:complete